MKHLTFLLVSGLLILAGCRKDEPEAKAGLTGDYLLGNVISTAPIVMYTQGGPITNQALIDRFLARRSLPPSMFSRTDAPVPNGASFTLQIEANKQARFINTSPGSRDTVTMDITSQLPNYVVLTRRDSATSATSSSGLVYTPSRCETLGEQMEVENPIKRCKTAISAAGISTRCRSRPLYLLKINAGQLHIPQLSWSIASSRANSSCGSSLGNVWNLFNQGVVTQLAAGDTVVVQERSVALLKK